MDQFTFYIILRAQVSDRGIRDHAERVAAAMEVLARSVGIDSAVAALAGLASDIDAQLCRHHPARRGVVAAELSRAEGVSDEIVDAVYQCFREPDAARLSDLAALLVAATAIVDAIAGATAQQHDDGIGTATSSAIWLLEPRARQCMERLGLDADAAINKVRSAVVPCQSTSGEGVS